MCVLATNGKASCLALFLLVIVPGNCALEELFSLFSLLASRVSLLEWARRFFLPIMDRKCASLCGLQLKLEKTLFVEKGYNQMPF
jgi:hypothetical protein